MYRKLVIVLLVATLFSLVSYSCTSTPETKQPSEPAATTAPTPTPTVQEEPAVNITMPSKQDMPVIEFSISPTTITAGGSVTLTWKVTNATSVMIDHGVGSVPVSGTKNVTPTTSTIYKLTASNASGASAVKTVSVIVNPASSGTKK